MKLNYLSGAIDSKELLQDCLYLQPSAVEKAWTLHFCPVGATADCESAHRSCPTCGSRIDSQQVSVLGQPLNGIPSRCMTGFHSAVVQEAVVRKRSTTLRLLKQKRSTSSTWREHLRSEETHKVISETSKLGLPDATTECDETDCNDGMQCKMSSRCCRFAWLQKQKGFETQVPALLVFGFACLGFCNEQMRESSTQMP